jgi:hypothetical protein
MCQYDLFGKLTLNINPIFKAVLREALKDSGLSREQVANQMTEMMTAAALRCPGNSKSISKAILDKWVGENAAHMMPLSLVPIFCAVTKTRIPLQVLCWPLGFEVISEEDGRLLAWARAETEKRKIAKRAKKLAEEIGL